jgi:hypothetical protein
MSAALAAPAPDEVILGVSGTAAVMAQAKVQQRTFTQGLILHRACFH